jgi:hypothetical protein
MIPEKTDVEGIWISLRGITAEGRKILSKCQ